MSKEWTTKGLIEGRSPNRDLYDIAYFSGDKRNDLNIQYPSDGSYLNPNSEYKNKFNDLLNWIKNYLPEGKILDAGGGPGHLDYWNRKRSLPFNIVICDVSYPILNWSKKQNPGKSTVNSTINHLPFKPNSFDGILFSDVLHHLWPQDAYQSIKQASMLLKDNGYIFINTPNRITWSKAVKEECDHVWLPSINEISKLLMSTNFNPNTLSYFTRGFPNSKTHRQIFNKDLRLPFGGRSIFICAQKLA